MRLKTLLTAFVLFISTAIFAIDGTVKVVNSQQNIVVVVDSGNGNCVPGETMRVLNCPSNIKVNDVLIVNTVEIGPPNNLQKVAIFVGLQQ